MTLVLKVNCRSCNRECGDYKHLLDETLIDNESTTLAALLNYCTSVELFDDNDDDTLPDHICNSCVEHLLQSYLFKEMVLQTDRQLRQHLKQQRTEQQKQYSLEEMPVVEHDIDVDGVDEETTSTHKIHVAKWASAGTPKSSHEHEQEKQDEAEYEMEEWLEIEEVVEQVVNPEEIDININGNELGEIKSEMVTDDEGDLVVAEEHDDFLPDKENRENSGTNLDIRVNTEDDEEYDVITADVHINSNNSAQKRVIKRTSLKGGNLTLADLICKYCGKQFDKMCRLREHTYMHTGEKPHICNICGKRSRTKTHHNVHMLTHSDQKRYKCSICGQLYRTSNSLRVHERKHTDTRPYSCPMCDKSYHTAEQRKLHVMLHTGERPHSCDKCGKAYRESYSLRLHMQTHEDQKPYQCEICGKGLTQMSGYKRHMLLHTGEYPHKCDVCGRAFRISSNLLAHKRLHLDVLPYQCTQCNKGFTTTTRLKRHMLQHERGNDTKEDVFRPRKQKQLTTFVERKISRSKVVEIL